MRSSVKFAAACTFTMVVAAGVPRSAAQEPASGAAALEEARARKARALTPPKAGFIERQLLAIERAEGPGGARGPFVAFGDIKRGSGPSLGPGYRRTFGSGAVFVAKAVYSLRQAKLLQAAFRSAPIAGGRLSWSTRARWQDVPEVAFHGLAPGIPGESASYAETVSEASAAATFRPVMRLRFDAGVGVERFQTSIGRSDRERVGYFAGVPGAGADPRYLHSSGSAALDTRESEGYTRGGSLLRATLHDYRDQGEGLYSFRRVDGVAEHYLPVLHGKWVVYLGLRASTTTAARGSAVPHFLMPDLGGHDLRGYDDYRFQNRHSILATAEYRWYAQEYLDAAIFCDAGKAVEDRRDLDFSGLQRSCGAGVRLHGPRTTALRLEVARSRESTRLILAFSPVGG